MITNIFWALNGMLTVQTNTMSGEKFVNQCLEHKIPIKNTSRCKELLIFNIQAYWLMRARKLRITRGVRLKIIDRKGFLRHFHSLLGRPALFLGAVFCCFFLFYMSRFIWQIDIASTGVNNRDIVYELEDLGLNIGVQKSGIDNEGIKNRMLLKRDELGWFVVNIKGCRATVNYSLKNLSPELIAGTEPCDVIASKLAVIKRIDNYKGTCVVEPGKTVFPGDLLISSEVKVGSNYSTEITYHRVHARGEITGRTWYGITANSPAFLRQKVYTGKNQPTVYIKFEKKRFNLFFGGGNYGGNCDIILEEYALGFGASLCVEKHPTYMSASVPAPDDELVRLENRIRDVLLLTMEDGRIIAYRTLDNSSEDCLSLVFSAECVEQIGVQRATNNYSGS